MGPTDLDHVVEFGRLTDAQRAELEGDELDPFDAGGATLRYRPKDHHVALRDARGRLIASAGLVSTEVEVARARFTASSISAFGAGRGWSGGAAAGCPSLTGKRVTPHTLRHTNAMLLRAKGVDIATIALWLGHESTQTTHIYEHADPALKEQAIARTAPLGAKPGRYRPSDELLAFLEGL